MAMLQHRVGALPHRGYAPWKREKGTDYAAIVTRASPAPTHRMKWPSTCPPGSMIAF